MPEGLAVSLRGLSKHYDLQGRRIPVMDDVHLEVAAGERVALVGASGSGKSTMLHVLGLLDRPTTGTVLYDGVALHDAEPDVVEEFRNLHVGFVFQFHHLLPDFDATENVMMPLLIGGWPMGKARREARELLSEVGLAHRMTHAPGELSGGEQQRVALARALARRPRLLLADEPTGNLDPTTGASIHALLLGLNRDRGTTVIMATHNHVLAGTMPRCLRIEGESLVETSPAELAVAPVAPPEPNTPGAPA